MSGPCRHPIQTDRHGHPPIGVSSCPVGEIGDVVGACGVVTLLVICWAFINSRDNAKGQPTDRPLFD